MTSYREILYQVHFYGGGGGSCWVDLSGGAIAPNHFALSIIRV